MAGNDHPDFSKPVMVAGTARAEKFRGQQKSSGDSIPNSEKLSKVSLRQVSFGREEET